MATDTASVAKQAEISRHNGNVAFKKERLGAAIDAYTEAITLCPDVAVYWSNRALCYFKRKDWERVEQDCRNVIQLDGSSVKARYMLGLALLEREDFAGGIKELEKAFDLERSTNPDGDMVEDVWQALAKAKYLEWELSSSKRAWRLQKLKDECESALILHQSLQDPQSEDGSQASSDDKVDQFELLNEVFSKALEDDTPSEVPDYLCCNITLDIFQDPVITPSGFTYEKAVLLEHLEKVGNFDPITRQPLDKDELIPNLAIKGAARAFLKEHGWAYKTNPAF
ncbi:E3 ubiquitin-protein ligase CHIP isoform X1 [Dendrobium catenatum]|uniref:E3 ubiquitin-protein ligase CHIP n=1 Tax=Dendrobium catenatum TaxID=906689 RepID=A0A2I0VS47_9ASPA|nr:E3 ubiquitin-protein ligase CHIP isoform X1 [Dendrobium catenatum]PKU66238.1 E3 ubiquitin-protein ligase CHIP [Dendrobium catenatum]